MTMTLIDWMIGNTSQAQQPAAAPGSNTATAALNSAPAKPVAATAPMPNPNQDLGPSGSALPSGQAPQLDLSTPVFLGGVTAESSVIQASAKYTVVDVPVRTISLDASSSFGATVELAIAHRSGLYAIYLLIPSDLRDCSGLVIQKVPPLCVLHTQAPMTAASMHRYTDRCTWHECTQMFHL